MKLVKTGIALLIVVIFLLACNSQSAEEVAETAVPTAATAVTEISAISTVTALPPTATTAPTVTPKPTDTPEPTEEPVTAVTSCVLCHSDKDSLIDTASPEEEKEPAESSGVG